MISELKNKIKFSHHYLKLQGQKSARLIHVKIIDSDSINLKLINYDTVYLDRSVDPPERKYYNLPRRRKLIHLTFLGNLSIPFCTIRSYTKEKEAYYIKHINCGFEIIIT